MTDITIMQRELTPFEHLVLDLLCKGLSNVAIAQETAHTEKVIENTVSRSARVFGITSDGDTKVWLHHFHRIYTRKTAAHNSQRVCRLQTWHGRNDAHPSFRSR